MVPMYHKIHINLAKMAQKISYFSVHSGTNYFISLSKVVPKVSYFSVHGGSTVGASIVAVGHVFAHLCTKQYIVYKRGVQFEFIKRV